jgi:hypothetical protein
MDHLLILLIVLLLLLILITSLGGSLSAASPPRPPVRYENFVQKTRKRSPVEPFAVKAAKKVTETVEKFTEEYQQVDGFAAGMSSYATI